MMLWPKGHLDFPSSSIQVFSNVATNMMKRHCTYCSAWVESVAEQRNSNSALLFRIVGDYCTIWWRLNRNGEIFEKHNGGRGGKFRIDFRVGIFTLAKIYLIRVRHYDDSGLSPANFFPTPSPSTYIVWGGFYSMPLQARESNKQ